MWLTLTLKNIKDFAKNKTILFLFIIISQVICIVAAFSVAGMIDAVTPQPEDERAEWEKSFHLIFGEYASENNPGTEEDDVFLTTIYSNAGEFIYSGTNQTEIEKVCQKYGVSNKEATSKLIIRKGQIPNNYDSLPKYKDIKDKFEKVISAAKNDLVYMEILGYTDQTLLTYFSAVKGNDEFINEIGGLKDGQNNIKISISEGFQTTLANHKEGDKVKLNSSEYTVSDVELCPKYEIANFCRIHLSSMDNDFLILSASVLVADDTSQENMGKISEIIKNEFSGLTSSIENPQPKPLIEKQFNNMIYVVSFILIAVVLLNISRLYTYILSKRKNTLMVCSLCGGSKIQMFTLYILEIFITLAVSCVIGLIIFRFFLIDLMSVIYPSFTNFFTLEIYLSIFAAYITFGIIIMTFNIIPMVRKSVTEMKRS